LHYDTKPYTPTKEIELHASKKEEGINTQHDVTVVVYCTSLKKDANAFLERYTD